MAYPLGGSPASAALTFGNPTPAPISFPATRSWGNEIGQNMNKTYSRSAGLTFTSYPSSMNVVFPGSRTWGGIFGIVTIVGPSWS